MQKNNLCIDTGESLVLAISNVSSLDIFHIFGRNGADMLCARSVFNFILKITKATAALRIYVKVLNRKLLQKSPFNKKIFYTKDLVSVFSVLGSSLKTIKDDFEGKNIDFAIFLHRCQVNQTFSFCLKLTKVAYIFKLILCKRTF